MLKITSTERLPSKTAMLTLVLFSNAVSKSAICAVSS